MGVMGKVYVGLLSVTSKRWKGHLYTDILVLTMGELRLRCKRCGYEWIYRGRSEWYATCPRCHKLIGIRKLREAK